MEHVIVISSSSDSSEYVEAHDDNNPSQSGEGSDGSVGLSMSPMTSDSKSESVGLARTNTIAYCQCAEEDFLVECLTCGSFFELGTFCPLC
jgi:hypothetical protein